MKSSKKPILGVLALQGSFVKHIETFSSLKICTQSVRTSSDLKTIDGLVIPGGESTVMCKMLANWNLILPIQEMIKSGLPVFGTCAGLILLTDSLIDDNELPRIGGLDMSVSRNAYGRQLESFEAQLNFPFLEEGKISTPFNGVFIRAPKILNESMEPNIQVLCRFEGNPVLIQKQNILAASFHPELAEDTRLHSWFLKEFF